MKTLLLAAGAMSLFASAAFSQTPGVQDGDWEMTIQNPTRPVVGDLVVKGDTGVFRSHGGGAKMNSCGGKETPVTVLAATPDQLKFTLEYSKVLDGCHDLTINAMRVDDKTLKGTWPDKRQGTFDAVLVKKN